MPAKIACAECPGRPRVAGEHWSRHAADICMLTAHALNVLPGVLRRRLQCLLSSPVCCFIGWEAGDVHGPAFSSASRADAVRLAMQLQSTFVQCWAACGISVSSCVSVSLERG